VTGSGFATRLKVCAGAQLRFTPRPRSRTFGHRVGTVSEPETLADPTCAECGRRPLPDERWSLRFADLGEVVAYCPDCDEREFADTT
jgi:hypothetical protein